MKRGKKILIYGIVLILIILLYLVINQFNRNLINVENSANYSYALETIEKCNQDMIEGNKTDWCVEYHDFYRECTYGNGKLYYCVSARGDNIRNIFGITKEETKEVCKSYLHKGLGAYCLRTLEENGEDLNECLKFAEGDQYLTSICNLKEGEYLEESKNINEYL